jgi:hypothetical protein
MFMDFIMKYQKKIKTINKPSNLLNPPQLSPKRGGFGDTTRTASMIYNHSVIHVDGWLENMITGRVGRFFDTLSAMRFLIFLSQE